jgi:hypothetical protein
LNRDSTGWDFPGYLLPMKSTAYFKHVRMRCDRNWILDEWIEQTIEDPEVRHVQMDGRIRLWKRIPTAEGRWLRVVLLGDGKTIHNVFFDRRFKGERK